MSQSFTRCSISKAKQEPRHSIRQPALIAAMNPQLPDPDYTTDAEWRWPWAKFGLRPDALFTDLHERFNTRQMLVQDPYAFHRDVVECANESAAVDEFLARLSTRTKQRMDEIDKAWAEISCLLGSQPSVWLSASKWEAFVRFCRSMSSDSMVMFFDMYSTTPRKQQTEGIQQAQRTLDRLWPSRERVKMGVVVDKAEPCEQAESTTPEKDEVDVLPSPKRNHLTTPAPTIFQPSPDGRPTYLPSLASIPSSPTQSMKTKRKRKRSDSAVNEQDQENGRQESRVPSMVNDGRNFSASVLSPDVSGTCSSASSFWHQPGKPDITMTLDKDWHKQERTEDVSSWASKKDSPQRDTSASHLLSPESSLGAEPTVAEPETDDTDASVCNDRQRTVQQSTSSIFAPRYQFRKRKITAGEDSGYRVVPAAKKRRQGIKDNAHPPGDRKR